MVLRARAGTIRKARNQPNEGIIRGMVAPAGAVGLVIVGVLMNPGARRGIIKTLFVW